MHLKVFQRFKRKSPELKIDHDLDKIAYLIFVTFYTRAFQGLDLKFHTLNEKSHKHHVCWWETWFDFVIVGCIILFHVDCSRFCEIHASPSFSLITTGIVINPRLFLPRPIKEERSRQKKITSKCIHPTFHADYVRALDSLNWTKLSSVWVNVIHQWIKF